MSTEPPKGLGVGEIAKRSGTAVSAIHFYERKGLISGWRTSGNQRRYPRAVLRRLAIIRVAQRAGISLEDIGAALQKVPAREAPTKADWASFTSHWLSMLEARITSLTDLRDKLTSCIGCGCLSLTECPLRNPDDILAREGPGPRRLTSTALQG